MPRPRPLQVVLLGARMRLALRSEVISTVLSAVLVLVLNASIWRAASSGGRHIGDLSPVELSTYVIVAWTATNVTSSQLDAHLGGRVRTGAIAVDLVRPLDLHWFLVLREIGRSLATLALVAVPVLAVGALMFPMAWPTHASTWAAVGVSLALGQAIAAQVSFLAGLLAFRLGQAWGITRLRGTLLALLSGAVVPLAAMPPTLARALALLPFAGLAHTPADLFLERADVLSSLGLEAAWAVALFVVARVAWSRALEPLAVAGG